MDNTKILEEKYGKPVKEWGPIDFNTIGLDEELSELLTVETCLANANDENLPDSTRNIFLTYVIADKFASAIQYIVDIIEEHKDNDSTDSETIEALLNEFKNGSDDYIKAQAALMLLLSENYLTDNEKVDMLQYEENLKNIIDSILEDLEFIGVKTFLSLADQYFELIYSLAVSYMSLYEIDLIEKYFKERMKLLVNEYSEFKKKFIDELMKNPEISEYIKSLNIENNNMDGEEKE